MYIFMQLTKLVQFGRPVMISHMHLCVNTLFPHDFFSILMLWNIDESERAKGISSIPAVAQSSNYVLSWTKKNDIITYYIAIEKAVGKRIVYRPNIRGSMGGFTAESPGNFVTTKFSWEFPLVDLLWRQPTCSDDACLQGYRPTNHLWCYTS